MANTSFWADSSGGGGITDLTGDVTATGPGSAVATIGSGKVTLAKMATLAANSVIGNNTGSSATPIALTAAQLRTFLADVDLRSYGIARAINLLGLTNPVVAAEDSFFNKPGIANSTFNTGSGTVTDVTTLNGGWKKLATASSSSSSGNLYSAQLSAVVSNVGTQKWYMLWLIKFDTTPNADSTHQFGFIDTGFGVNEPCAGMIGSGSTTKFRFYDGTTGVNSAVSIDTGVHMIESWCVGDGVIHGSVDSETAVSYTTGKTQAVTPFIQVSNGATAAVQAASFGHMLYITAQS